MAICESCNETSPSPVSDVTVNQTVFTLGDDLIQHEWNGTGDGAALAFTMDATFVKIDYVSLGQAVQPDTAYTIVGTLITFDDAPALGEGVTVRGLITAP